MALIPPEAGETTGCVQLPHSSVLCARSLQRLVVALFGLIRSINKQEQLGAGPVDLRVEEPTARFIRLSWRPFQDPQPLLRLSAATVGSGKHSIVQRPRKARLWVSALVFHLLGITVQSHRHKALAPGYRLQDAGEAPLCGKGDSFSIGPLNALPIVHQFRQVACDVNAMNQAEVVPTLATECDGISR
jgi:hypothetical protein